MTDALGRPIRLFLTAGNVSDYVGARALMGSLPQADWMLADRGYDADWFRNGLKDMEIEPCIPSRKSRKTSIPYDRSRYKLRHKIENMFGRLKDWRRISMCYDRYAHTFISAICVAATFIFWFPVLSLEARPASSDLRSHCRFSAERKNQKSYNLINQSPG